MSDASLFKVILWVLGLTILAPLFVAATNLASTAEPLAGKLDRYYASGSARNTDKKGDTVKTSLDEKPDVKTDSSTAGQKLTSQQSPNTSSQKNAGTYTVKAGDTYGCIAERYYGSYDQWPNIYEQNAGWPGYGEYDLAVGAVIQLPAVSADQVLPPTRLCQ